MIIKISDIPAGGRDLQFRIANEPLNSRINAVRDVYDRDAVKPPEYLFDEAPTVNVHLDLQGLTVVMEGKAEGKFSSSCSRCGNSVETPIATKVRFVLKPKPAKGEVAEEEDVDFGYYDGKEIDCGAIAEEAIVLNLPYAVYCSDNGEECEVPELLDDAEPEPFVDERFAILKNIKLN